jgi:hypothetical protein
MPSTDAYEDRRPWEFRNRGVVPQSCQKRLTKTGKLQKCSKFFKSRYKRHFVPKVTRGSRDVVKTMSNDRGKVYAVGAFRIFRNFTLCVTGVVLFAVKAY